MTVAAVGTLLTSGRTYDEIGRGGPTPRDGADPAVAREAGIRPMLDARNALRRRRGREPLDVEAEVAREIRALGGDGV